MVWCSIIFAPRLLFAVMMVTRPRIGHSWPSENESWIGHFLQWWSRRGHSYQKPGSNGKHIEIMLLRLRLSASSEPYKKCYGRISSNRQEKTCCVVSSPANFCLLYMQMLLICSNPPWPHQALQCWASLLPHSPLSTSCQPRYLASAQWASPGPGVAWKQTS